MWDWMVWSSLIFGGVAGSAAMVLVGLNVREAWRVVTRTRRDVIGELDGLATSGEATAERVAAAGDTAQLQESLGRLRLSLARLAVLRAAIGEVDDAFGSVTAVIPRK